MSAAKTNLRWQKPMWTRREWRQDDDKEEMTDGEKRENTDEI